ncbi:MAG: arginine--tRNA ligase [Planctomycetaceae bacterium]|jgi:arginyl-tRNA synthetase|nr:arginine--tRNA ligase [Planctomycetaceae bacterium]
MILEQLKSRFANALHGIVDDAENYLDLIRPSQDDRFGDYQANIAMPLAKKLAKPPRAIANQIITQLNADDLYESIEVAGAGFINIKLNEQFLISQILKAATSPDGLTGELGIAPVSQPRKYIVDYSGPNVAKPMHVGHLRSTVLGNAITNMLRFRGHHVITDNHLGDWGTQFGMIILGFKNYLNLQEYKKQPVEELNRVYKLVRQLIDNGNQEIETNVLAETAKLHNGNTENLNIWKQVMPHALNEIEQIYNRLNIKFDYTLGESFYHHVLPDLVNDLLKRGIAKESEGAVGVFFEDNDPPMLVRKKDGAFLYGTTDIATLQYRIEQFCPHTILYLTDSRQSLHFEQLFKCAKKLGINQVELLHIKFGAVLGEDGKPFKTRSGDTIGLNGLLDEAEAHALQIVKSNNHANLTEPEQLETAKQIGIGAIIYADLSQNRESDYTFSYDKMLALTGNTAAYMQYAYARVQSIFAKGGINVQDLRADFGAELSGSARGVELRFDSAAERRLALEILKFGDAVDFALKDYRPNLLTTYLFDLANHYSTFFEKCPVLRAENKHIKNSRLLLCDLTAKTLKKGLELLGIKTVEKM